jgi:GNAT superfamily N-acetyltransferase
MAIEIRPAAVADAKLVAGMAVALTGEIMAATGTRHFNLEPSRTGALCERLLRAGAYVALIARDGATPVGFAGLCESHALYTEGTFGIIQEFYVVPERRSAGIGTALLEAARAYARSKGWKRLELCTPPLPAFQRSLAFYERNGFEVTGGRKMKSLP